MPNTALKQKNTYPIKKNQIPNKAAYLEVLPQKLRKGDERKMQIIQAAIECISTVGIENTTFESIAKSLNIRASHVAYYFPDKKDLIASSIKVIGIQAKAKIDATIQQAKTPKGRLKAYIKAYFTISKEHHHFDSVFLLFFYYCKLNPVYQKLYSKIHRSEIKQLIDILKEVPNLRTVQESTLEPLANTIRDLIIGSRIPFMCTLSQRDFSKTHRRIQNQIFSILQNFKGKEA